MRKCLLVKIWEFHSISPDNRDLNYDKYFVEGNVMFDSKIEINSNNSKLKP